MTIAGRLARHGLVVLLASVLCMTALALATAFVATRGNAPYQARLAAALQDGTLGQALTLPFDAGTRYHAFAFNDCLVFSMLTLADGGTPAARIISPLVPVSLGSLPAADQLGLPPYAQCADLARTLDATAEVRASRYHRYLHGHRAVAGVLLYWLTLQSAGWLLLAAALLPYLATAGLACAALLRRRSLDPARDAAYLALALALPVLAALPVYGRSFGFAPGDAVIGAALLSAFLHRAWAVPETSLVAASAVFGALTAIFEFLSGGLPAGLVLLVAVAALEGRSRDGVRRLALMLGAYLLGFGACFALKLMAVLAEWGPAELTSFAAQLSLRIGHAGWDIAPENAARLAAFGVSVEALQSNRLAGTVFAFAKLLFFSPQLGFGSLPVGLGIVVLGPLALLWRAARSLRAGTDPATRWLALLLLVAACVVALWYMAFLNHTIVHAHFMVRLLAWPAALALAGEAWRLADRRIRNRATTSP